MDSAPTPLDLHKYLRALWRRKIPFVLCLVLVPVAAYFLANRGAKQYESSVVMQIQGTAIDTTLFAAAGIQPPQNTQSIAIAARLVQTTAVARRAATLLPPPRPSAGALLGAISVSSDETTGFITISAKALTPQRAAQIATAFSRAIIGQRSAEALHLLDSTISQLHDQLLRLTDPVARRQLSSQLQRLRALRASQGSNASVIEPAGIDPHAVSPRPGRALKFGIAIGLLLGFVVVALLDALDRRIRDPAELEEVSGLPLLSAIPHDAFPGEKHSHAAEEAFYTLRASLMYFNIDRRIKSVVVTSPAQGDGKTTVSVNLAIAAARSGKDVILVDADLRRPSVLKRLEGQADAPGLGALLVGETSLDEALVDYPVEGPEGGRLRIISGGSPAPNPSELTGSERMSQLLRGLEGLADLVIIDTNPVLAVSDAIPLLEQVSGVLVVARLNRTSRDALTRLIRVVTTSQGTPLGIVATGASIGGIYGYAYGYGYGYAPTANGSAQSNGATPEAEPQPVPSTSDS